MSNDKISIVVPVYNVERYLDYCMQSIIAQDYQNIEVILVDDGSTDSSGKICDEYSKRDSRVTVVHKLNGGVSSARNEGIKAFTGDYLTFIDPDDYIRVDYVSRLYEYIKADDSDMAVCSYRKVLGNIDFSVIPNNGLDHYIYDSESFKLQMVSRQIPMYVVCKLYRGDLARKIHFPEGRIFEDMITSWNIAKSVDKVSYSTDELYYYRQRADSIVNSKYMHSRMDHVYFSEQIYSEVEAGTELCYAAASRCFFSAADNYSLITESFSDDKKYIEKTIKKYRGEVLKDMNAGHDLRFLALISYLDIRLVGVIGRLYKKRNYRIWRMSD